MRYQIYDKKTKNIVDQNLTYEEALVWIDSNWEEDRYEMKLMKEDN